MVLKKTLFTGGSGTLGKEIIALEPELLHPTSKELDITSSESVSAYFEQNDLELVIHAAAFTNVPLAETEALRAMEVNVVGTYNLLAECMKRKIKFVFVSTDYVFDGEKGDYTTEDPINPLTNYAKSKAAAELMVRMYDNSLTVRTSFFPKMFPYDKATIDQWTTKDYVDLIAPKILSSCLSDEKGVIHCGHKKRTIFHIAKVRRPDVKIVKREDLGHKIPKDTSLC
jgi:dTDP-4-dehydrorhamnose reductase